MRGLALGVALVMGLFGASGANADSLRCQGQLVRQGDSMADVVDACGAPDFEDRWAGQGALGFGLPMQEWTYNPGPRRLIQTVVFRGDRVVAVNNNAGYGFRAGQLPASGDCDPGLITAGLTKYRLLQACGPPLTDIGYFITSNRVYEPGLTLPLRGNTGQFIYRERWTYDFGPNRLRRIIQLDNARVVDITLGHRGR